MKALRANIVEDLLPPSFSGSIPTKFWPLKKTCGFFKYKLSIEVDILLCKHARFKDKISSKFLVTPGYPAGGLSYHRVPSSIKLHSISVALKAAFDQFRSLHPFPLLPKVHMHISFDQTAYGHPLHSECQ